VQSLLRRDERDLRIPDFGLHERKSIPAEEIVANLRANGWPVYSIGGAPGSKSEFLEAIKAGLPTDPPLGNGHVWDALIDSVWAGIYELRKDRVAIVWAKSSRLAENDPNAYRTAKEILTDIVFGLADPKFSPDHSTRLLVVLA
jgi:Barstar (barnase inhibitor)